MPSGKRARPSFSPPRPGKSKSEGTKSTNAKKSKATSTATSKVSKSKANPATQRRSRYTSATESESDSQAADTERENEDDDQDDDEDMHESLSDSNDEDNEIENGNDDANSPEPDYILAEITSSTDTTPPVPLPLIHRILYAHFSHPEKTKISKDAREVLGKYIEVFVREAIMRCAYEKTRPAQGAEAEPDAEEVDGGGWLEVDDLEKVAVQLCLDF